MKSKTNFKERSLDFLPEDLCFIEKSELGTPKKDIAEVEKNVNSADKIFREQPLNRNSERIPSSLLRG